MNLTLEGLQSEDSAVTIQNSFIQENTASVYGGGIYTEAPLDIADFDLSFLNCSISYNT
jgi:predicted outer membrane repeat protein